MVIFGDFIQKIYFRLILYVSTELKRNKEKYIYRYMPILLNVFRYDLGIPNGHSDTVMFTFDFWNLIFICTKPMFNLHLILILSECVTLRYLLWWTNPPACFVQTWTHYYCCLPFLSNQFLSVCLSVLTSQKFAYTTPITVVL